MITDNLILIESRGQTECWLEGYSKVFVERGREVIAVADLVHPAAYFYLIAQV